MCFGVFSCSPSLELKALTPCLARLALIDLDQPSDGQSGVGLFLATKAAINQPTINFFLWDYWELLGNVGNYWEFQQLTQKTA